AADFAVAIQRALDQNQDRERICREADVILGDMSWDAAWQAMEDIMRASMHPMDGTVMQAVAQAGVPVVARLAVVGGRAVPGLHAVQGSVARSQHYDYLVVGAGFAGSVLAERLAAGMNK